MVVKVNKEEKYLLNQTEIMKEDFKIENLRMAKIIKLKTMKRITAIAKEVQRVIEMKFKGLLNFCVRQSKFI